MGRRDLSLSLLCEDRVKGQSFTSQEDDVDQDQEANIPEPGPWTSHSLEQEKKKKSIIEATQSHMYCCNKLDSCNVSETFKNCPAVFKANPTCYVVHIDNVLLKSTEI